MKEGLINSISKQSSVNDSYKFDFNVKTPVPKKLIFVTTSKLRTLMLGKKSSKLFWYTIFIVHIIL